MCTSSVTGTATGAISPGTGATSAETGTSRTIGTEIDGSTPGSVRGTSVNAVTLRVTAPPRPRTYTRDGGDWRNKLGGDAALFTLSARLVMLAECVYAAIFAPTALASVRADSTTAALFAKGTLPAVGTNTTASALLASTALSAM